MNDPDFEWDEDKARLNVLNHGLSFELAQEVFRDIYACERSDEREDYDEARFNIIGMVQGRLVAVTYTIKATKLGLISARKAGAEGTTILP